MEAVPDPAVASAISSYYENISNRDLEAWLSRLVSENDPIYTHTAEGSDDMPSHIKAALTATTLSIPIVDGRLGLGTWQGIYLWEHRRRGSNRNCLVHVS